MQTSKWMGAILSLVLGLALAMPALAADTRGTVKKVDSDKKEIVVTIQARDYPFQLAENAPVKVGNQQGKLSDLKPNDTVIVSFAQIQDKLIATRIIRP